MNRHLHCIAGATLAVGLLASCATSVEDPEGVGSGPYLQLLQAGKVMLETDTSNAGMLNCPTTAYRLMQEQPLLTGSVKCSSQPTSDTLLFYFRAHRQLIESDEYSRSSPYLTRTATNQLCVSNRQAASKLEKTVIVEDRCSGTSASSVVQPQWVAPPEAFKNLAKSTMPMAERLRQLEQLKSQNMIDSDEYAVKRRALLEEL